MGVTDTPEDPSESTGTTLFDDDLDEWPETVRDTRRRARAITVQVLYEVDLTRRDSASVAARRIEDDETPAAAAAVARSLVAGVVAYRDEIDRTLAASAPQWPVERIDPVERAILRLATYEVLLGRRDSVGDVAPANIVPIRVAINEAVELARLFGTEASVRFVNGVLGAVARAVAPEVVGVVQPSGGVQPSGVDEPDHDPSAGSQTS